MCWGLPIQSQTCLKHDRNINKYHQAWWIMTISNHQNHTWNFDPKKDSIHTRFSSILQLKRWSGIRNMIQIHFKYHQNCCILNTSLHQKVHLSHFLGVVAMVRIHCLAACWWLWPMLPRTGSEGETEMELLWSVVALGVLSVWFSWQISTPKNFRGVYHIISERHFPERFGILVFQSFLKAIQSLA